MKLIQGYRSNQVSATDLPKVLSTETKQMHHRTHRDHGGDSQLNYKQQQQIRRELAEKQPTDMFTRHS